MDLEIKPHESFLDVQVANAHDSLVDIDECNFGYFFVFIFIHHALSTCTFVHHIHLMHLGVFG